MSMHLTLKILTHVSFQNKYNDKYFQKHGSVTKLDNNYDPFLEIMGSNPFEMKLG